MSRRRRRHWGLCALMLAGIGSWWAAGEPFRYDGLVITVVVYTMIWFVLSRPRRRRHRHGNLALLSTPQMRAAYRKRRKDAGLDRSDPISARLRRMVLAADRHRCVYCRARGNIQVDHYFPYALGGRATLRNCMALCGNCNKLKSDFWRDRDGYVHYHPWAGLADASLAAAILAAERRHRRNPLRWTRAALAMAT